VREEGGIWRERRWEGRETNFLSIATNKMYQFWFLPCVKVDVFSWFMKTSSYLGVAHS